MDVGQALVILTLQQIENPARDEEGLKLSQELLWMVLNHPVEIHDIIQRFNLIRKKELSDRFFRKVVSDLVTEHKKAICTMSDGGYYVARTGSGLDAAAIELESKGAACFDRARQLRQCDPIKRQESLF